MPVSDDGAPKYWFRAKRYGWGWGLPLTWQGWVTLVAYFGAFFGATPLIDTCGGMVTYMACVGALTAALILVCWLKGEPPRWRWGGRDE